MTTQEWITFLYTKIQENITPLSQEEKTEVIQGLYEELDEWLNEIDTDDEEVVTHYCIKCKIPRPFILVGPLTEDLYNYRCTVCGITTEI